MKRAAIVGALSCAALAGGFGCTNDFDGLFVDGNAEDDDDIGARSSSGKPGPGKPLACGATVETCSFGPTKGDVPSNTCSGCGCECGLLECPAGKSDQCALGCVGGANCSKAVCDSATCIVSTDQSTSNFTCSAFSCSADCKNGSTCTIHCEETDSCVVTCDPSSTCTVFCPDGDGCNVTCGKGQPATLCEGGSRVCGECPG